MFGDLNDITTPKNSGGQMTDGIADEQDVIVKGSSGVKGVLLFWMAFILPGLIGLAILGTMVVGAAVLCAWVGYTIYLRLTGKSLAAVVAQKTQEEAVAANDPFANLP